MRPPIDKACGEGLMPDSRRELALLGVDLVPKDGGEFTGIRFVHHTKSGTESASAQFPSNGRGIGLRRQALHTKLVAAAEEAGVALRWETPVQFQEGHLKAGGGVEANGKPLHYGWLVGADGQTSRVRRWAALERGNTISQRFGFRRHFAVTPWSPYVEVHWSPGGQAYVTPVGPNEVCIATVARNPHCRLQTVLDEMPWLQSKLRAGSAAATPLDAERGAITTTRRLRRVARGRIALIGDASGSADAVTGEGMALGFRQASLLAESIERGNLEAYNRLHPRILRLPQTMARVMLLMDRSAAFRTSAIHLLATEPHLFAHLLRVHVGSASLPMFIATHGLELAWRLAMPAPSLPAELI
jgi:menaquinone-9 beta-reductase